MANHGDQKFDTNAVDQGTSVKSGNTAGEALIPVYQRFPVNVVKGKGSYVWDDQGERYLDFTSGLAVCNLGHVPDSVTQALQNQLDSLWHCSNLYHIPLQEELAQELVKHSCAEQVFFCNSGAEANEAAIKLVRKYAQSVQGTDRYEVVTFKQSFHGRTLATLTATGQDRFHGGFHPLPEGFRYLTFNDWNALDELMGEKTCAVMLELVQGEGGVVPADPDWVKALAARCKEQGLLLVVDEVQTGLGRTGSLFAYEQYGIEPDVFTLAKGLGSGFPIGAMLAKKEVAQAFTPGSHASTFGGNPLAATAGLATLKEMTQPGFLDQVQSRAAYLEEGLKKLAQTKKQVKEVRGKGLLQGLVLNDGIALSVVEAALQHKVLILIAGPEVIRILPPLTCEREEIDQLIDTLDLCLK